MQVLDLALSTQKIQGFCLLCFENERPPRGVLGYLDWIFAGHFTQLLKTQVLTGKEGQILYTPVKWNGSTVHFVLVGGGSVDANGSRPPFQKKLLEKALEQAKGLQLEGLGIVASDWNFTGLEPEVQSLQQSLQIRNLCVLN